MVGRALSPGNSLLRQSCTSAPIFGSILVKQTSEHKTQPSFGWAFSKPCDLKVGAWQRLFACSYLNFFSWRSVCYILKALGCLSKVRGLLKTSRKSNSSSCFQTNVLPEPIIPFTVSQHRLGSWKGGLGGKIRGINLNMPNKNQVAFKFHTTSSPECLSVCTGWKITRNNLEGLQTVPVTVQRGFYDPISSIALSLLSDWDWLDLGYFDACQRLARLLSNTFSR